MKTILTVLATGTLLVASWHTARAQSQTFVVATNGNDLNPGTKAKPFATIERARDAIRELKKAGLLKEPVTVCLRGGVYRVGKTIEFLPEDSGTERAPVTYAAFGNEQPVVSGGRQITGW